MRPLLPGFFLWSVCKRPPERALLRDEDAEEQEHRDLGGRGRAPGEQVLQDPHACEPPAPFFSCDQLPPRLASVPEIRTALAKFTDT